MAGQGRHHHRPLDLIHHALAEIITEHARPPRAAAGLSCRRLGGREARSPARRRGRARWRWCRSAPDEVEPDDVTAPFRSAGAIGAAQCHTVVGAEASDCDREIDVLRGAPARRRARARASGVRPEIKDDLEERRVAALALRGPRSGEHGPEEQPEVVDLDVSRVPESVLWRSAPRPCAHGCAPHNGWWRPSSRPSTPSPRPRCGWSRTASGPREARTEPELIKGM